MSEIPPEDRELRVSYPVVVLLADIRADLAALARNMDARFDQIRSALDERVTNTVFEALRSDMGMLAGKVAKLESDVRDEKAHKRGFLAAVKEFKGWLGWVVATGLLGLTVYELWPRK